MRLYTKEERSSFSYWFAHWRSYQKVAMQLHAWKFKYLFHDIEKPFLMFLWKDYPRVQKWHRTNNRHHLEYDDGLPEPWKRCDYIAMVIDWECSRFTKAAAQANAYEEMCNKLTRAFKENNMTRIRQLWFGYLPALNELKLLPIDFYTTDLYKQVRSLISTIPDNMSVSKE